LSDDMDTLDSILTAAGKIWFIVYSKNFG
jgi:hypothetical protein